MGRGGVHETHFNKMPHDCAEIYGRRPADGVLFLDASSGEILLSGGFLVQNRPLQTLALATIFSEDTTNKNYTPYRTSLRGGRPTGATNPCCSLIVGH